MADPGKTRKLASKIKKTVSLDDLADHSDYVEVALGSTLAGRYRVDSKLGEGGMGVVYKGYDTQLDKDIAIKLLKRGMSQNEKAVEKLKQEAQVAMMLTHPYIMRLINFERDGEYAFLLMEYVEGETLDSLASREQGGRLDDQLAAIIGYKVCEALEYAHGRNVVHRDIKPANIMIGREGDSIKLMDFGIARALMMPGEKHAIAGTLAYIAPEIFGGAPPDPRADIYALGLTLYELLAGGHPFQGRTAREIIDMSLKTKPPQLERAPRPLMSIIFQCIEKKPNARFQTAKELKSAFAKYLDLDEGAKVSRMKDRLEQEKRKMVSEMRRLERERERLKSEYRELSRSRLRTPAAEVYGPGSRKTAPGMSLALMGVAAISGIAAAIVGGLVSQGGAAADSASAAMAICAIVAAVPAFIRDNVPAALAGAVAGAVLGYMGYGIGESYIGYSMEHNPVTHLSLVSYAATGLPIALAAGVSRFFVEDFPRAVKITLAAAVAVAVSAFAPYIHLAEDVLGFGAAGANYFYIPFLAVVVWGAVDLAESA